MCPGAFMGTGAVSFCLLSTVSCSKGDNIQVSFFLFVCVFFVVVFICLFGLKEQNPTWDSSISCLWNSSTLPPPLLDTNPAPNGLEKQITLKADKGQSYLPPALEASQDDLLRGGFLGQGSQMVEANREEGIRKARGSWGGERERKEGKKGKRAGLRGKGKESQDTYRKPMGTEPAWGPAPPSAVCGLYTGLHKSANKIQCLPPATGGCSLRHSCSVTSGKPSPSSKPAAPAADRSVNPRTCLLYQRPCG